MSKWSIFALCIIAAVGLWFYNNGACPLQAMSPSSDTSSSGSYQQITASQVKERLDKGDKITVIDVRTPDEYAAMIADNTICDALADYTVQPGDVFFLPAGRIHSIGAGCFIAEIQQTCNVTYRIYDFNRKDKNGNTRELHTELSKDAIDYTVEEDYRTSYTPEQNKPIELVTCPYFTTSVYDLTENMTMDYSELDSFVIYICMEGSCTVTDNEGHSLEIQAGESILFPATTKEVNVTVNEHVKFLETYV